MRLLDRVRLLTSNVRVEPWGCALSKLEFDVETFLTPEHVRSALLDFSDRRPEVWPNLSRKYYEVYSVGDTEADVREGSEMPGMTIWAREHYDWSQPHIVRWTARESTFCTPGSYMQAAIYPRYSGGTRVHVEWDRVGTGIRGKLLVGLIRALRGKPIRSGLQASLRALEKRSSGTN